jgi:hypothetical protein
VCDIFATVPWRNCGEIVAKLWRDCGTVAQMSQ